VSAMQQKARRAFQGLSVAEEKKKELLAWSIHSSTQFHH